MQARLAFAISMAIEFDCLLIDEMMAVGDHRFTEKCNAELFEKRGDRAMVIVAHQTDLIRAHCDHAAILDQGRRPCMRAWMRRSMPMKISEGVAAIGRTPSP